MMFACFSKLLHRLPVLLSISYKVSEEYKAPAFVTPRVVWNNLFGPFEVAHTKTNPLWPGFASRLNSFGFCEEAWGSPEQQYVHHVFSGLDDQAGTDELLM